MNVAQQILNLILKMMYYDDFKSSFTQEEKDFIQSIRMSSMKHFRVSNLFDRRTIMTWESSIDETVACYASDTGFHFSTIETYKSQTKRMKGLAKESLSPTEMEKLEAEIQELKKIFRVYSQDVEVYFK